MSENIKVLRHPPDFISFWSHHEKMVVIDQKVGYLGGLDLCFGRMDNFKHKLLDIDEENLIFPGIDYSNCRIADFNNVKLFEKPLIDRKNTPRLPWHDIAMRVIGDPVKDMARHFIQYWNFAKLESDRKNEMTLIKIIKKNTVKSKIHKLSQRFSHFFYRKKNNENKKKSTEINQNILNLAPDYDHKESYNHNNQRQTFFLKAVTEEEELDENEKQLEYYLKQKSSIEKEKLSITKNSVEKDSVEIIVIDFNKEKNINLADSSNLSVKSDENKDKKYPNLFYKQNYEKKYESKDSLPPQVINRFYSLFKLITKLIN